MPDTTDRDWNGPPLEIDLEVRGPWSLSESARFWEAFTPAALPDQSRPDALRTVFVAEHDWKPVEVTITQHDDVAHLALRGVGGDLEAAAEQVRRFLSIDIDGTGWPAVGDRDPVIGRLQQRLPGFRPCGFHSPYEAAAWSVLSQRIQMRQAARLRDRLIAEHGENGAFPSPQVLQSTPVDLPGRKEEYLHAVAEAALDGVLDGGALRRAPLETAFAQVRSILGIGPFAAELVVIRGTNAPDVLPRNEARLQALVAQEYGTDRPLAEIGEAWRPFRSWAAVHLRTLGAT